MARDKGKGTKETKGKGIASSSQDPPEREARTPVFRRKPPRELRVSRHKTRKEHEAEVDTEREIEEALKSTTEIEEEAPVVEEEEPERRVDNIPPYTKLLAHIKKIPLASMRFPDISALRTLGILEDVRLLLRNMGMESFLGMAYPVHEEVSYQFLASVSAVFHDEYDEQEGFGHIVFKVKGKLHRMGFKQLSSIFGLSDDAKSRLPSSTLISNDVWTWIAEGARDPGSDKCNEITSPWVRYATKILSHTLYCRREPGGVNEDELKLLRLALLPLDGHGKLQTTTLQQYKDLRLIGVLVRRFIYYKYWAWTARPSDADDEGPTKPGPLYGTDRYHFQPYRGATTSAGLREALSQNAKLLKWNKMQDRTIHKLKESVKVLKRQMRKVAKGDVMSTAGPSTLPRPSFYNTAASARSPDSELRRQRRNRPPPARESSNESPSIATADDWDTDGSSFYP
ncbi:hypothetical protein Rs2_52533 [Raphanus sativus]|nr:hypothetical protein Rs2_52533 [Raphanus sativus]